MKYISYYKALCHNPSFIPWSYRNALDYILVSQKSWWRHCQSNTGMERPENHCWIEDSEPSGAGERGTKRLVSHHPCPEGTAKRQEESQEQWVTLLHTFFVTLQISLKFVCSILCNFKVISVKMNLELIYLKSDLIDLFRSVQWFR